MTEQPMKKNAASTKNTRMTNENLILFMIYCEESLTILIRANLVNSISNSAEIETFDIVSTVVK